MCNCPNDRHGIKHTAECYEAQIERLQGSGITGSGRLGRGTTRLANICNGTQPRVTAKYKMPLDR